MHASKDLMWWVEEKIFWVGMRSEQGLYLILKSLNFCSFFFVWLIILRPNRWPTRSCPLAFPCGSGLLQSHRSPLDTKKKKNHPSPWSADAVAPVILCAALLFLLFLASVSQAAPPPLCRPANRAQNEISSLFGASANVWSTRLIK
jgi:hypothetical protein